MKHLILGDGGEVVFLVNNEAIVRILNIKGKIVLAGIGWQEYFDWEKLKYGKNLTIKECFEKGLMREIKNKELSEEYKNLFGGLWKKSKELKGGKLK